MKQRTKYKNWKVGDVIVLKKNYCDIKAEYIIQIKGNERDIIDGEMIWLPISVLGYPGTWWTATSFREATDREAFLFYTHGPQALIKESLE